MGRRAKEDRGAVRTTVVGVKLSEAERSALDHLVEVRSAEIAEVMGERVEATASGVLRWLLLREAKARGMPIGAGARPPGPSAPARRPPSAEGNARRVASK